VAEDIRRIAEIEIRFREINERMRSSLARVVARDELLEFVCECGHGSCTDAVRLTLDEYDRVREDARHFAVVPGHEIEGVETVVEQCERYAMIEKEGPTVPLVRETDPRG
jgi:hypothetical protein